MSTGMVATGTADPHWLVLQAPSLSWPVFATCTSKYGAAGQGWVDAQSGGATHWVQRDPSSTAASHAAGDYLYAISIFLPANYGNVQIAGDYAGDNDVTISLNGVPIGGTCTNCFKSLHPFALNSSNASFLVGYNTLAFHVKNSDSYSGLLVEATLTAKCVQCVQPPQDMVAWYPLDEPVGATSAHDIGGAQDDVGAPRVASNSTPIGGNHIMVGPGTVGGALGFLSVGYLGVSPSPEVDLGTADFSIDAWVRVLDTTTAVAAIVDKTDAASGYAFFVKGNRLVLAVNGSTFTSQSSITPFVWHHVAVTAVRGGVATFYLDGAVAGVSPGVPTPSVTNSKELWIGKSRTLPSLETWIDELELFKRALTPPEVAGIFGAQGLGKCRPPVLCVKKWRDSNASQTQDANEPGMPGWTIKVTDASGAPVALAVTLPPDGSVCIPLPGPGTFTVAEQVMSGFTQTYPGGAGTHNVTVAAGQTVHVGFGNK